MKSIYIKFIFLGVVGGYTPLAQNQFNLLALSILQI